MSPESGWLEPEEEILRFHHSSSEVVSIAQARYFDRLEPEEEARWQELVTLVKESGQDTCATLTSVWENEDVPTAFRDRAMLVVVGSWETKRSLGFESMRGSLNRGPLKISASKKEDYEQWRKDLFWYQYENELPLVAPYAYLVQTLRFFEDETLSNEAFEELLSTIDLGWNKAEYRRHQEDSPLDRYRFPLLHDILFDEIGSNTTESRLKLWAKEKLMEWIALKNSSTYDANQPKWLKASIQYASEWSAQSTFQALFMEKRRGKDILNWEEFGEAVKALGWGVLDMRFARNYVGRYIKSEFDYVLKYVKEPQMRKELTLFIVAQAQKGRTEHGAHSGEDTIRYRAWQQEYIQLMEDARKGLEIGDPRCLLIQTEIEYSAVAKNLFDMHCAALNEESEIAKSRSKESAARRQAASSVLQQLLKGMAND